METKIIQKDDWTATLAGMSRGDTLTLKTPTYQQTKLLAAIASQLKKRHNKVFKISYIKGHPFILKRTA